MNRAAKFGKRSPPASCTLDSNMESMKKVSSSPRNPLKELNSISSTSLSVEAPRGCLSFFLPNNSFSRTPLHRPKSHHKTPKSAPNPRPLKPLSRHPTKNTEKPTPQKNPQRNKKTAPCLTHWQKGISCNSRARAPMPQPKPSPFFKENYVSGFITRKMGSEELLEKKPVTRMMVVDDTGELPQLGLNTSLKPGSLDDNDKGTPVHNSTPGKDANKEGSVTTTPPVQASISPEIQCGSSMISTTPACFAAGHVLSGVTYKRKCRPRGILAAGEDLGRFCKTEAACNNDDDDDNCFLGTVNCSRLSLVPAPTEASMHWLLSPCEEDQKGSPHCGPAPPQSPSSSLSSGHGFSSDNCGTSNTNSAGKKAFLISPSFEDSFASTSSSSKITPNALFGSCSLSSPAPASTSTCIALMLKEERGHRYEELATESFSCDSLSSQNVICTPQSDSSSDRCVGLSWLKNGENHRECRLEFDSLTEALPSECSCPMNHTAMGDPVDVLPLPGFSFQFTHSTTLSNPRSHSQLRSASSEMAFGILSVGSGSLSPSQMRISWREGLVSRIFEMDEFDCCQWLSDDEKDKDKSDFACELEQNMESGMTLANDRKSPKSAPDEPGLDEQDKVKPPTTSISFAESISTVGSGDSDWTLCYKNQLFDK